MRQRPDARPPVPSRIFAADQRSSFYTSYIGIPKGETPTRGEIRLARRVKSKVIGDGFRLSEGKVKANGAVPGLLIDEELGDREIKRQIAAGSSVGIPVEVSGNVFNFELQYGTSFAEHIRQYEQNGKRPAFVKALINYSPDMPQQEREAMFATMKKVSEFCQQNNYPLMAEVLIKETPAQLEKVGGSKERFDTEIRPNLAVQMIADFREAQIPINVWKIEGMNEVAQYNAVLAEAAKAGNGTEVIVLGRNASMEQLTMWLTAAAQAEVETQEGPKRIFGFAIGRSIWGELVKGLLAETRNDREHRNRRHDWQHPVTAVAENIIHGAIVATGTRRRAERTAAQHASERYVEFDRIFTSARRDHITQKAGAFN